MRKRSGGLIQKMLEYYNWWFINLSPIIILEINVFFIYKNW